MAIDDYANLSDDSAEVAAKHVEAQAVEAALNAFVGELEVRNREAINAAGYERILVAPEDGGAPTEIPAEDFVATARETADGLGREATRKLDRAGLTTNNAAILAAKRRWLTEERLPGLEREHRDHSLRRAEFVASLDVSGDSALTDAERTATLARIEQHDREMTIIASAWTTASDELARLDAPPA